VNWLIVERYENWCIDFNNKFKKIGFPLSRLTTVEKFNKGDLLFIYIGNKRQFSDLRTVVDPSVIHNSNYIQNNDYYPLEINTEPLFTLDEGDWISIVDHHTNLDITKRKKRFRYYFRKPIVELTEQDSKYLKNLISNKSISI
jgi:hypothetical protein